LIGSDVRLAVLPQGKCNSFFTSLIGKPLPSLALESFKSGATRSIDCGVVAGQPFFTSVGLGLLPALCEALAERSLPRFGIGWSRLASKVAAGIERHRTPVRIDAYRFDLEPMMITVSILPYCLGLNLSPTAIPDDHKLEVTLDMGGDNEPPSKFIREVYKQSHHFDNGIRLYRGEEIIIGSTKGRMLYLDGELISTPTNNLEIGIQNEQIQVCFPGKVT
jgi:diacylglycerol kinase family enzyme